MAISPPLGAGGRHRRSAPSGSGSVYEDLRFASARSSMLDPSRDFQAYSTSGLLILMIRWTNGLSVGEIIFFRYRLKLRQK